MASGDVARCTGLHTRYDADQELWRVVVHILTVGVGRYIPEEYIAEFATWTEVALYLTNLFAAISARPGTTAQGF